MIYGFLACACWLASGGLGGSNVRMTWPFPPFQTRMTPSWPAAMTARDIGSGVTFRVRSGVHPWAGSFGDVDRAARSLAWSLQARGVGPGDVVAFQLPNWVEAGITFWAAAYLGAAVVPVVHFYGAKEVDHILRETSPDVIVTADRFGRTDHLEV